MTPGSLRIGLAFLIVYGVWGSNYLAISIGVRDVPPLMFAAARFALAGPLLLAYAWWRRDRLPAGMRDWVVILSSGAMMHLLASFLVVWAHQWVPSGQAALILASTALWMGWLGTLGGKGEALGRGTVIGLLAGLGGVALLVADGLRAGSAPLPAYAAVLIAAVGVAAASVIMRRFTVSCGSSMTAAIQVSFAGLVLSVCTALFQQGSGVTWTGPSLLALSYLVVFGSLLGYGVYYWLVHRATPAQLGTNAYVSPAVAVFLGWLVLGEHLSLAQSLGTVVILLSVAAVNWPSSPPIRNPR